MPPKLDSTTDDPVSPPRLRKLSVSTFEQQQQEHKPKRRDAKQALSKLFRHSKTQDTPSAQLALKSQAVVGRPTTSPVPGTIIRRRTILTTVIETEEEFTEEATVEPQASNQKVTEDGEGVEEEHELENVITSQTEADEEACPGQILQTLTFRVELNHLPRPLLVPAPDIVKATLLASCPWHLLLVPTPNIAKAAPLAKTELPTQSKLYFRLPAQFAQLPLRRSKPAVPPLIARQHTPKNNVVSLDPDTGAVIVRHRPGRGDVEQQMQAALDLSEQPQDLEFNQHEAPANENGPPYSFYMFFWDNPPPDQEDDYGRWYDVVNGDIFNYGTSLYHNYQSGSVEEIEEEEAEYTEGEEVEDNEDGDGDLEETADEEVLDATPDLVQQPDSTASRSMDADTAFDEEGQYYTSSDSYSEDSALGSSVEVEDEVDHFVTASIPDDAVEAADLEDTSGIAKLKALHKEEVAQLKTSHKEDLNIFAEDLQEEKSKTERAYARVAKSNKELRTLRNDFKELQSHATAVDKRIQELEAQLAQEKQNSMYFVDEATEAYKMVKQTDDIMEQEQKAHAQCRKDRDSFINQGRRIYQEGADSQNDFIDQLQGQIIGLNHQMRQVVAEYQKSQLEVEDLQHQLGRQKVLVQVLTKDHTEKSIARVRENEPFCMIRSDQLHDAQQALMVSQDLHKKQVKGNEQIALVLEQSEQSHQSTQLELRNARKEIKALRKSKALSTDYRKAYEGMFLLYAAQDISDDSRALKEAAQKAIAKEQALTEFNLKQINEKFHFVNFVQQMEIIHKQEIASKDQNYAELYQEKEKLDEKDWQNGMAISDLEQQLEDCQESLDTTNDQLSAFNEQLQHRAFGKDYEVVMESLKAQSKHANNTIAAQQEKLVDQENYIKELMQNNDYIRYCMDRLQPARSWRVKFYKSEAVTQALLARFAEELAGRPLLMSLEDYKTPLENDDEKAFLDAEEDQYMNVNYGSDWRKKPDIQFTYDENMAAAYKDMVAAVQAQGGLRRAIEFEESAGIGLQDEIEEGIENAAAQHQLADIIEAVGAEHEVEEMTEKKEARLAQEQAARVTEVDEGQHTEKGSMVVNGESVAAEESIVVYEDDTTEESSVVQDNAEDSITF